MFPCAASCWKQVVVFKGIVQLKTKIVTFTLCSWHSRSTIDDIESLCRCKSWLNSSEPNIFKMQYSCCVFFPQVECKAVMVFFHYCVLSNYFWLFIEGLYLFTLLVETFFPEKRYFYWYTIIGWGKTQNYICTYRINTRQVTNFLNAGF